MKRRWWFRKAWRKKISFGCGNKINCRMVLLNLKQLQISRQLGRTSRPVCTICGCSCATKCVRLSQLDPQKLREGDQGCSLHLWTIVWYIHVRHMYRYICIYIYTLYIHLATSCYKFSKLENSLETVRNIRVWPTFTYCCSWAKAARVLADAFVGGCHVHGKSLWFKRSYHKTKDANQSSRIGNLQHPTPEILRKYSPWH